MKNLKKIIIGLFTIYAVCCLTGCLSLQDSQEVGEISRHDKLDSFPLQQKPLNFSEHIGNIHIRISSKSLLNDKPLRWFYMGGQGAVHLVECYEADSNFTTHFLFEIRSTAEDFYDEIKKFILHSGSNTKNLYKNITLYFGGLYCYEIQNIKHENKILFTYCFSYAEIGFSDNWLSHTRVEGKKQYIGNYIDVLWEFSSSFNPNYDISSIKFIDSIDTEEYFITSRMKEISFVTCDLNKNLDYPIACYPPNQKLYIILFAVFPKEPVISTSFYFDDKERALLAWKQLKQEYFDAHKIGGGGDRAKYLYQSWTLDHGGDYCTQIRYNYGQIFEYCFKGKGAKHNPFDGGLVTSKDAYVRPYLP